MICPVCKQPGKHAPACSRREDDPEDPFVTEYCSGCRRAIKRFTAGTTFCETCKKRLYMCGDCSAEKALAAHVSGAHGVSSED